jgi:hypothetical protein
VARLYQLRYHEALVGMVTAGGVMLYALFSLRRSVRLTRTNRTAANSARLLLALAGFCFGLDFFCNSLALAWLTGWVGPYDLIPHPYDTVLAVGTYIGGAGAALFGSAAAILGFYAWRRHAASQRTTMSH